jgi:DNA-directed RNA polymerase subunit RPC12/RpoP
MKTVKKGLKRWCPYCKSNKWEFIESVPITLEMLQKYLLVKYKCLKCDKEFLAEEGTKSKYVTSAERCFNCQSKNVNKISREGADIELYMCNQCHAYMGIEKKD